MEDAQLLCEYVRSGSQEAFAELVRRHVNLVYSVAIRQVRDPATAEDVTQVVFIALARRAGDLRADTVLSAWLFKAARLASRNVLRMQARRTRHEQKAAEMRPTDDSPPDPNWEQIEPGLNDALARLNQSTRSAILLRFFENKSFREVAVALGITELAARQRVFRGLEKLRELFACRSTVLPAAALGELLARHAIHVAPTHLASQIASTAAGAVAASAHHLTFAKGVAALMAWTKTKIAVTCAAGLLLIGGAATITHHFVASNSDQVVIRPGTLPKQTRFPDAPPIPGMEPPYGTLVTPDGKPLPNVPVAMGDESNRLQPFSPTLGGMARSNTDRDGHFNLGVSFPKDHPWAAIVSGADGFAQITAAQLQGDRRIIVQPWAHVEGFARFGDRPATGARVRASRFGFPFLDVPWSVNFDQTVPVGPDGHFVFDRIVPGGVWLQLEYPGLSQAHFVGVRIRPGEPKHVDLGGAGRTLAGKTSNPQPRTQGSLTPVSVGPPENDAGLLHDQPYQFRVESNGTFKVRDIPPGTYHLDLTQTSKDGMNIAASVSTTIVVPPLTSGQLDQPIEVGVLSIAPTTQRSARAGRLRFQRSSRSGACRFVVDTEKLDIRPISGP
jgi:RNA polymerase sigma factor (sigma-70 family)